MKKRPKFHSELPLGLKIERGTAETFLKSLINNNVDLSGAKQYVKKALDRIKLIG